MLIDMAEPTIQSSRRNAMAWPKTTSKSEKGRQHSLVAIYIYRCIYNYQLEQSKDEALTSRDS
jgi:hypothetical protein